MFANSYYYSAADVDEMIVTWHTLEVPIKDQPHVEYGTDQGNLDTTAPAETTYFEKVHLYTYRARMSNLQPATVYCMYKAIIC